MKQDRCTALKLNLGDIDRAVESPQLATLLLDGWVVITTLTITEGESPPLLLLILAPPRPALDRPMIDVPAFEAQAPARSAYMDSPLPPSGVHPIVWVVLATIQFCAWLGLAIGYWGHR